MTDRRLCKCHGVPMQRDGRNRNGIQKWCCGVKKSAAERIRYQARMETPEGRDRQHAKWLRNYHNRQQDPVYRLERAIREMVRVRVR